AGPVDLGDGLCYDPSRLEAGSYGLVVEMGVEQPQASTGGQITDVDGRERAGMGYAPGLRGAGLRLFGQPADVDGFDDEALGVDDHGRELSGDAPGMAFTQPDAGFGKHVDGRLQLLELHLRRADDVRMGRPAERGGDRQAFGHRMTVPGRIAKIEAHDREIAHATIPPRSPPGREHLSTDSESAGKSWKNRGSGLSGDLICRRKGV